MPIELAELLVADAGQWRDWLERQHAQSPGVWLVLHKVGGQVTTLDYDAALDEALCFGWIDGQLGRRDAGSYRQRFTPRRPRSPWSARNVGHVARLMEQGRMAAAGLAAVEAAQADGRWEAAYAGAATAEVPADFLAAIAANPAAQAMFAQLTSTNRYAFTWRIGQAKRPKTRAKRIADYVDLLAQGKTLHPQRRTPARDAD